LSPVTAVQLSSIYPVKHWESILFLTTASVLWAEAGYTLHDEKKLLLDLRKKMEEVEKP
jgi:hypothetical protein